MRIIPLLFSVLLFAGVGCDPPEKMPGLQEVRLHAGTMGTTYNIAYLHPKGKNYTLKVNALLSRIEGEFSTYDENSAIVRMSGPYDEFSAWGGVAFVFTRAKQISEQTDGAFDPTIAPLARLWGFSGGEKGTIPSQATIDSMLQHVGMEGVTVSSLDYKGDFDQFFVKKENIFTQFDMNGIAKGYAADAVATKLDTLGVKNYMVEIGGEVRTRGLNAEGEVWRIGIDKPLEDGEREIQQVVLLDNMSMATSGNYRNYHVVDGRKVGHTINPKTGYPEHNELLSATVFSKECIDADAYATAFMVMGLDKAMAFAAGNPELEAYFIYGTSDGGMGVKYTKGVEALLAND
jgi:thiamine biosynthesis lipoprotein